MLVPAEAADEFFLWLEFEFAADPKTIGANPSHVLDIVRTWLAHGHGAWQCSNDYGIYLSTVLVIANNWARKPECIPKCIAHSLNVDRSQLAKAPSAILDVKCHLCEMALDPQYFAKMAHDPDYYDRIQARLLAAEGGE